jgi:hypothetical protein
VTDDKSTDAMDLAFNKKRADDRKSWLKQYDRTKVLRDDRHLTHRDFVDYELIHFSNYDLERSLPSAIDGLKVSQRKIIFGCFKRKLTSEIRVAQLAGYISEAVLYHHEVSLRRTSDWLRTTLVPTTSIFSDRTGNSVPGSRVEGLCVGQVHPYRTISCHYENFPSRGRPGVVTGRTTVKIEPTFSHHSDGPRQFVHRHWYRLQYVHPVVRSSGRPRQRRRYALSEELQPMTPKYRGFKGAITAIPDDNGNVQKWSSSGIKRRVTERPSRSSNFLSGRGRNYKTFLEAEVAKMVYSKLWTHTTQTDVSFTLRYATAQDATDAMVGDTLRRQNQNSTTRRTSTYSAPIRSSLSLKIRLPSSVRMERFDWRRTTNARLSGERIGSSTHPTEREGQVCFGHRREDRATGKKSRP